MRFPSNPRLVEFPDDAADLLPAFTSGRSARPLDPAWPRSIRDQCVKAKVPWGAHLEGVKVKGENGNMLDGRKWEQFPI